MDQLIKNSLGREFKEKITFLILLFIFLLTAVDIPVSQAIGFPILNDSLLELQISKEGYTRINIENEKINDVFIHPQEAAEVVIHNSGGVLVLPQIGKEKVYLTIIGEHGTTQDLLLRFTGKSPNPVRLLKLEWAKEINNNIKK